MSTAITIGTRVRTNLYNRGNGTVFAIHGEQAPETVGSICGIIRFGGRASFDIVFDQGSMSKQLPECILRGVQWEILDDIADSEAIAVALARARAHSAKATAAASDAKARFAAKVERLRTDPALAMLTQDSDTASGKLATKNIRVQLRGRFPGIKFSVKVSRHGTIDISWTDGPTSKQVRAIADTYRAGHYDGMDDLYRSSVTPWNTVFGGADYVFTGRLHSDALVERAISSIFATYAGNFAGSTITATPEDYRAGRLFAVAIPLLGATLETAIQQAATDLEG